MPTQCAVGAAKAEQQADSELRSSLERSRITNRRVQHFESLSRAKGGDREELGASPVSSLSGLCERQAQEKRHEAASKSEADEPGKETRLEPSAESASDNTGGHLGKLKEAAAIAECEGGADQGRRGEDAKPGGDAEEGACDRQLQELPQQQQQQEQQQQQQQLLPQPAQREDNARGPKHEEGERDKDGLEDYKGQDDEDEEGDEEEELNEGTECHSLSSTNDDALTQPDDCEPSKSVSLDELRSNIKQSPFRKSVVRKGEIEPRSGAKKKSRGRRRGRLTRRLGFILQRLLGGSRKECPKREDGREERELQTGEEEQNQQVLVLVEARELRQPEGNKWRPTSLGAEKLTTPLLTLQRPSSAGQRELDRKCQSALELRSELEEGELELREKNQKPKAAEAETDRPRSPLIRAKQLIARLFRSEQGQVHGRPDSRKAERLNDSGSSQDSSTSAGPLELGVGQLCEEEPSRGQQETTSMTAEALQSTGGCK